MIKLTNPTDMPGVMYDVMQGGDYNPFRILSRVTREQAEAYAARRGMRIDWNRAHMLGLSTAEVPMVRH
jgi:hypothetical protein